MNIIKIELQNFRNYKKKIFDNFSNLNILIGTNGIGKTSVIEAIYLGSLAKSFKTNNEESIINNNSDYFRIKIYYYDYGPKKNLELYYDKNGNIMEFNVSYGSLSNQILRATRLKYILDDRVNLKKDNYM